MITKVTNFKRKDLFNMYNERTNPFLSIVIKVDVTNIVKYCKINKNFYATMGYIINKAVNKVDEFKYSYKDGEFYYCDTLKTSFTQMKSDETISFFSIDFNDDYKKYIENYKETYKLFLENKFLNTNIDSMDIWLSCSPWYKFESLTVPFDKNITNPQFIWDKYEKENDKYYVNMFIMVHHGFVDGYHISKFINELNKNIEEFKCGDN